MIWFTSDQHFNHENIIRFCNRPFSSVGEMDEAMISRWNAAVEKDDLVYHLGDFTLGNLDVARYYFSRLKGRIHVIPGGHDKRWRWKMTPPRGTEVARTIDNHLVVVLAPLWVLHGSGYPNITLCHYPMRTWEKSHYDSWHLYGHHHRPVEGMGGKSKNVGVDLNEFELHSMDDIAAYMRKQPNNWDSLEERMAP